MLILRTLLLAAVVLGMAGSAFAQLRTDALLDSCKRKTQVWESVQTRGGSTVMRDVGRSLSLRSFWQSARMFYVLSRLERRARELNFG